MSDRVTNVEIEDVLSAIRRLVSDGASTGTARVVPIKGANREPMTAQALSPAANGAPDVPVAADAPEMPDAPDAGDVADTGELPVTPGKLVLTPDFRISLPDEGGADEEPQAAQVQAAQVQAGAEAAPSAADDGEIPGGMVAADPTLFDPTAPESAEAEQAAFASDLPFDFLPRTSHDEATGSVPPVSPEFSPEFSPEYSTVEGAALQDLPGPQNADPASTDPASADPASSEDPSAAATDGTSGAALVESAGGPSEVRAAELAAEIEAATERAADDWEPDGSEAVPVMDWTAARQEAEQGATTPIFRSRKAAPLALSPDLAVPPEEDATDPDDPAFAFHSSRARVNPLVEEEAYAELDAALAASAAPTGLPDEELLRELVLQVLRQELQGALGERITHNVRRLVRREINRILSEAEQG